MNLHKSHRKDEIYMVLVVRHVDLEGHLFARFSIKMLFPKKFVNFFIVIIITRRSHS